MSGDVHVRICESVRGWFPCATRLVLGCRTKAQAQWLLEELKERFAIYGLKIHPEKTKIVQFSSPNRGDKYPEKGNGTFDFLGFTHFWAKNTKERVLGNKKENSQQENSQITKENLALVQDK